MNSVQPAENSADKRTAHRARYEELLNVLGSSCTELVRVVIDTEVDGDKYLRNHHVFSWPPQVDAPALTPSGIQGTPGYPVHMTSAATFNTNRINGYVKVDLVEATSDNSLVVGITGQEAPQSIIDTVSPDAAYTQDNPLHSTYRMG